MPVATTASEGLLLERFRREIADDLMTPRAIPILEEALTCDTIPPGARLRIVCRMDEALGLRLCDLSRADLRIRPADAGLLETEVETRLEARRAARAKRNYAEADRLRADLDNEGVVVMDGDPLAWEWRVEE